MFIRTKLFTPLFALLLAAGVPASAQTAPCSPSAPPKRLALLVGINKYKSKSITELFGAINDIESFRNVLTVRFSFAEEDITSLKNEQATRAGIFTAFAELTRKACRGDEVVFYYAGHGSTVADPDRPSGQEQTIVPWDETRDPTSDIFGIRDSELRDLFGKILLKTPNITAILDSCHSGTAVRGIGGTVVREIPRDPRPQPRRSASPPVTGDRGIVFIAGSGSDQKSNEGTWGVPRGAMSHFLSQELMAADPDTTWQDVMDRVKTLVNAQYPTQEPQLEGAAGAKRIFGNSALASEPYYLLQRGRESMLVRGGAVHGLAPGSVFEVYSPRTRSFAPGTPSLGKFRLTQVDPFTSDTDAGPRAFPEGSRAVERERAYPEFRFRIFWDPRAVAVPAVAQVRNLLTKPVFASARSLAEADFQVTMSNGRIVTAASDGSPRSEPLDPADPDIVATLQMRLEKWAKWNQLAGLHNSVPGGLISIKLVPESPRPGGKILSRDKVAVTLRNLSQSILYVSVLDLDSTGSVTVYQPGGVKGSAQKLPAGGKVTFTIPFGIPPTAPPSTVSIQDVVMAVATSENVDFTPLVQTGIRAVTAQADNSLTRLFADALSGTRQIESVDATSWSTAAASIRIFRQ